MKFSVTASALTTLSMASSCTNTAFGATDSTRDGCEWYEQFPTACGDWDDDDFRANDMCCACDGGLSTQDLTCHNSNQGLGDSFGDKCGWYSLNPSGCGAYDTEEFVAAAMCCGCEGGCYDVNASFTDSTGDDCGWYDRYPDTCGEYDTEFFSANDMCCACRGGYQVEVEQICSDTNNDIGDVGGDQCDWYERNSGYCGYYDTEDFVASAMCCTCGGGSTGTCEELNDGFGDITGDQCDWYAANPSGCGLYDTDEFSSNEMCCACGGGTIPSEYRLSLSAKFAHAKHTEISYTTYAAVGGTVLAALFCANYAFKGEQKKSVGYQIA